MEADISIWRKPGHFYFALTRKCESALTRKCKAEFGDKYQGRRRVVTGELGFQAAGRKPWDNPPNTQPSPA
jgi:hypothetical protein